MTAVKITDFANSASPATNAKPTANDPLRVILEEIGTAARDKPLKLACFVAGTLTIGYRHHGKSLPRQIRRVLRQLVAEGVFSFDETSREYRVQDKERVLYAG